MIYFKACQRCQGDMLLERDRYGQYLECIQCGYETDPLRLQQTRAPRVAANADVDAAADKLLAAAG